MRMRAGQSSQERPTAVSLFLPKIDSADQKESVFREGRKGDSVLQALDMGVFDGLYEVFDQETLVGTYRELLFQTRQRLKALAADPSPLHCRQAGHTLRGTASMFGANKIAILGTELEHAADAPERQAGLLRRLEAACDELEVALRRRRVSL